MTSLSGMTGFGRAGGEADWGSWTWEAKSVNGRGLDVRVNVPTGFEGLDQAAKKSASARFTRGNMQIGLRLELASGASSAVNAAVLDTLCAEYEKRVGRLPVGEPLAMLMTSKGVLETGTGASDMLRELGQSEDLRAELLSGFEVALEMLESSRLEEGASLNAVLGAALGGMERETQTAETEAGGQPAALKDKLEAKLAEIQAENAVDADRLAAEVALAAAKADVREELDRLAAHIETGRGLLASGEPVGRKLDFLAQELNREANTLCSKSTSLPLTNAGLALKTLIDQFKEQAANVE